MHRKSLITFSVLLSLAFLVKLRSYAPQTINILLPTIKLSTNENIRYNYGENINIGFSNFALSEAVQRQLELQQKYDLTAIILHWKRSESAKAAFNYLFRSNHFKEIIIWNNNPQIHLDKSVFQSSNRSLSSLRIINSKENLKDEAKYRACAEAKTMACFYADDDWDASFYLKSLIAGFRAEPHILHSVTDPYTFYTNLVWSYFDSQIDLHTGFSWIGCGSVFLREYAQRHLEYIRIHLKNYTNLVHLSDVFFSIWLNDIPSQMNMNIRSLPRSHAGASFSSTSNFLNYQHRGSVLAIRILEHSLRQKNSNETNHVGFSRRRNHRFPYYVKSSNLKDEFIFFTNILPMNIEQVPFNISKDYERGTRKNLPRGSNVSFFKSHTTLKTVDSDKNSCWRPGRNVSEGEFFGIDFLSIQTNLSFAVSVSHSKELQTSLDFNLSLDGIWWITYRSFRGITIKYENITSNLRQPLFVFNATEFNDGFHSFRYAAFNSSKASLIGEFRVCEVKIMR